MTDKKLSPEATPDGIKIGHRVIGWTGAVRQFDGPRFDHCFVDGLLWMACIQEAREKGWIDLCTEQEVILWRWLVVTVFLIEERDKNGFVKVPNASGGFDEAVIYCGKDGGGMSIYAGPERFCMANHVESIAIEKYGSARGPERALQIYKSMLTINQEGFTLSDWGRDALVTLHDDLIKQLKTKGMPDMPVMH